MCCRYHRGRVEDGHAVTLDDLPPAVAVREVRRPLVQNRRRAVAEGPVDDVAVAGDPADVGGAPVDVGLRLQVEDVVVRRGAADEVAGGRVNDALRLGGRAGRVHEEQEVLRVHRLGRAAGGVVVELEVVQPDVAPLLPRDLVAGAADDEAAGDAGYVGERLVGGALERHRRAAPPRFVLRDEHLAAHVVHPAGEGVGGEAAEDDGVRRAEPRAGEHRDRQLRDHAQVDGDAGAAADS
jgi:hypothetical protein